MNIDDYNSNFKEIKLKINVSQAEKDYQEGLENWERNNSKEGRLGGRILPDIRDLYL